MFDDHWTPLDVRMSDSHTDNRRRKEISSKVPVPICFVRVNVTIVIVAVRLYGLLCWVFSFVVDGECNVVIFSETPEDDD